MPRNKTTGATAVLASLWVVSLLSGCLDGGQQGKDPVAVDFPLAYVKRPLPMNEQGEPAQQDLRDPLAFNAGGDLYLRERAAPSAADRNITWEQTQGEGDVKDVDVSYEGTRLLFSLRLAPIEGADEDEQPTWNIWEYDRSSGLLRRIIASDITAEEGHDLAPHYLADGRIVFASTRQRQAKAILLDEGKPQFSALDENRRNQALVLHVMNADGSDIHQVSFNQSNDTDPSVLDDGRVLFSRWDHAGSRNAVSLYSVNPDGSELRAYYGVHSHGTGSEGVQVQFVTPRPRPDGGILALLRPFSGTYGGGDLVLIDGDNFTDHDQSVWSSRDLVSGGGQTRIAENEIHTDTTPSPGGRFAAAYPLWDGSNRALVSWSACRVLAGERIVPCTAQRLADADVQEAAPLYGLFVYDWAKQTQLPIVAPQEGIFVGDVVAMQPRPLPTALADRLPGAGLEAAYAEENVGVLHIRSVYDFDANFAALGAAATSLAALADPLQSSAAQRPARFLRIEKAVSIPDDNVRDISGAAFGRSSQQGMREIIGYAPIEPDGSVMVKVPGNVALALSVVDADARRIAARHQNWLQLRPGEILTCNGCHDHDSGIPHGRPEGPPALNGGATTSGLPFPNTTPAWLAEIGETMAQTRARIGCMTDCASLLPSVDVNFADVWSDPAVRTPDLSFNYRYADLQTPAPASQACQTQWSAGCRVVINYETHIHPLWNLDRRSLDNLGNVVADNTCTSCHRAADDNGVAQVPAAQLDLTDGSSSEEAEHFKAYRELLFADNEQELVGGVLQDRLVQATDGAGRPRFETDADGNLVLDGSGQPIAVMEPVTVDASLSVEGAGASSAFFARFAPGGDHQGRLSAAELRLLSEWVDIGAQYFNNPFDAPEN